MSYSAPVICSISAGGVSESMSGSGGASLHAEGCWGTAPGRQTYNTNGLRASISVCVPVVAVTSAQAKRLARTVWHARRPVV